MNDKNKLLTAGFDALDRFGAIATNPNFGDAAEWSIKFVPIGGKTLGNCNLRNKVIKIDTFHFENSSYEKVLDTVLHEVAHALAGVCLSRSGRVIAHGALWKKWALMVGANPKATTSPERGEKINIPPSANYVLVYIDKDDKVHEAVSYSTRKLKNIKNRYLPDRKGSLGKLYSVAKRWWDVYSDDFDMIVKYAFN